MKITALLQGDEPTPIDKVIEKLKSRRCSKLPDLAKYRKQWNPLKHDVFDKSLRKDKEILKDGVLERFEKVNRLGFPLQKRITKSAVSFAFGNETTIIAETQNPYEELLLKAVKKVLFDNKIDSFNRRMALDLFRATETAELWYATKEQYSGYGFESEYKIRVAHFSAWNGDVFYPYFLSNGSLEAFSREYTGLNDEGNETKYFETFTKEEYVLFEIGEKESKFIKSTPNPIGKIQVVYGRQESAEWEDIQVCIDRLELLLSNFAETNDYHASPKIFITGVIKGFAKKGESGAIIEGDANSRAEYLSWQNAPESVRLEIDTLLRFIYGFTQTPDVSFDSVKGLNSISGIALEMLFMDAHLKVQDKREVFDEYLQRRLNIIKAYLGLANIGLKNAVQTLDISAVIHPFKIADKKDIITNLMTANGGMPIISQKTSVARSGLVSNSEEEFAIIQDEAKNNAIGNVFASAE